jgi:leader peptidase (prepilin peptidase) / N-methyltransferase
MIVYCWLPVIFVLGAALGSFFNVCIARLPLEKSLLWPLGSRCGHCLQPIHWYDNIPLVSYWILRGRCRTCRAGFSVAYFLIELATALGFVGLFDLVVIENVHNLRFSSRVTAGIPFGDIPATLWIVFGHHATLFSFLLIVAGCDISRREIPLSVTFTGAGVGLVLSMIWPWPWPNPPMVSRVIAPAGPMWLMPALVTPPPLGALQPWPIWWPLPALLGVGGDWQTGLANGLAGMLAGTFFLRGIRFLFSTGLGREALGLGDADLMMMAGCFLGWQPIVAAFFLAVFPALVFGVAQRVIQGDQALPFGPALALGVMLACLFWDQTSASIGPELRSLFFNGELLLLVVVGGGGIMLAAAYVLRLLHWLRGDHA